MELDILFWLAIGAIYLFQMFAGRKKRPPVPGQSPLPSGPVDGGSTSQAGQRERRGSSTTGGGPSAPGDRPDAPQSLQEALREISDIMSGRATAGQTGTSSSPADGTGARAPSPTPARPAARPSSDAPSEFRSPIKRKKESKEDRAKRLAELRKKHRTHQTKTLSHKGRQSRFDDALLDEDVFERRSRPRKSSTYDDLFESPLYESFGDPIEHRELKVEILEPSPTDAPAERHDLRLSREEARRGIILSEILGPPVSRRRR